MFAKKETQNPFNPFQLDVTNPNLNFISIRITDLDIYYFQEKNIIELLQQDIITEKDYQRLFLLVNTPIPAEHCITLACWLPIAKLSSYEAFKTQEQALKSSLSERFDFIKSNARFTYKTAQDQPVYLLQGDLERLDARLIELLTQRAHDGGYFTLSDLQEIECKLKQDLNAYAKQSTQSDDDKLIFNFTLADSSTEVHDEQSYQSFQSCKKTLKDSLPQLIRCIVKMRFLVEFDESASDQDLHRQLENNMTKTDVRLNGFTLLTQPQNRMKNKQIQQVLNQLLFDALHFGEIKRLFQLRADLNAMNSEMRTVLGHTLLLKQEGKAMQLLVLGANPDLNSYHSQGQSNLMVALNNQLTDQLIFELIKKSKELDFKNQLGETALIVAIKKQSAYPILVKLIENTKEINAKDNQGYRALDYAIRESPRSLCSQTIKKLIGAGASTSIQNDDGNFPLIEAAYRCNLEAVKYIFLSAPELINEQNNKGDTALLAVLNKGSFPEEACGIIDFLIKNGANPGATNKEGNNGFLLAKKYAHLNGQLEKTLQDIAKEPLSQDLFLAFILSLSRIVNDKNHRLASPTSVFMKFYLAYLHGLDGNNTPKSKASLLAQLNCLQKQPDFSVRYINKIHQDILSGGEAHKALLIDNPDLIDRFSRIKNEVSTLPQTASLSMRSGRSFFDNKQLILGESAYLFSKLDDFLKNEALELGEDFAFILSDPRFWALPKDTLKLMYENQSQCKHMIKEWGLSYEQLRELSQKKLDIFSRFNPLIDGLKQKKCPIHELIRFDEARLRLLLENPAGLYALLNLNFSFERLRKIEINQLGLWVENPGFLNFLFHHILDWASILTIDSTKFNLLSRQLARLSKLIELDIPFDSIIKLSIKELTGLLMGNQAMQQALEKSLLSNRSGMPTTLAL